MKTRARFTPVSVRKAIAALIPISGEDRVRANSHSAPLGQPRRRDLLQVLCAFLLILFGTHVSGAGEAFHVSFDRNRYDIDPGQTFAVQVVVNPVPLAGLSSFGVKLGFSSVNARVTDTSFTTVPPLLDFNGVAGASAVKMTGPNFAAAKGTVDFFSPIQVPYQGRLLSTFLVTDQAAGSHTLSLSFFNTLGSTEQIFVDGAGAVLDPGLTFGTALVNYRPTVRILAPTNSYSGLFPGAVTLLAEASDLDGSIASVTFLEGTNIIGRATNAPYQFVWAGVSPGGHVVFAQATDNLGAMAVSSNVAFFIRSNSPPRLAVIGNRTVVPGTLINLILSATDPDSPPQTLSFSLLAGPLGARLTPAGQFSWTPSVGAVGTNSITVRVSDNGSPILSDQQTFQVVVINPGGGSGTYAIFGGETGISGGEVFEVDGKSNTISGRIHSNSSIDISGERHTFRDGIMEYVTSTDPKPDKLLKKFTFVNSSLVRSNALPYPLDFALADFAPGGVSALQAQAEGKYHHLVGNTDLKKFIRNQVLEEGLYFVEGRIDLKDKVRSGRVTLVATDEIEIETKNAIFESFTRCLFAFSVMRTPAYDQEAIQITGESSRFQGIMFAPFGGIELSAMKDCVFDTSLVGRGVEVSGARIQISGLDLAPCAPLVPPLMTALHQGQFELSFRSVSGRFYVVECTDSLTSPNWQEVAQISGDGSLQTLTSPLVVAQRFYRLRVL